MHKENINPAFRRPPSLAPSSRGSTTTKKVIVSGLGHAGSRDRRKEW